MAEEPPELSSGSPLGSDRSDDDSEEFTEADIAEYQEVIEVLKHRLLNEAQLRVKAEKAALEWKKKVDIQKQKLQTTLDVARQEMEQQGKDMEELEGELADREEQLREARASTEASQQLINEMQTATGSDIAAISRSLEEARVESADWKRKHEGAMLVFETTTAELRDTLVKRDAEIVSLKSMKQLAVDELDVTKQTLEVGWQQQVQFWKEQLQTATAHGQGLQLEVQQLQETVAQKESNEAVLQQKIEHLEDAWSQKEQQWQDESHKREADMTMQLEVLQTQVTELHKARGTLSEQEERFQALMVRHVQEEATWKEERESLSKEISELREEKNAAMANATTIAEESRQVQETQQQALQSVRAELSHVSESLEGMKVSQEAWKITEGELLRRCQEFEREGQEERTRANSLRERVDSLTALRDTLQSDIASARSSHSSEITALRSELHEAGDQVSETQNAFSALEEQHRLLKQQQQQGVSDLSAAHQELEQSKAVAEQLQVKIETLVGERKQHQLELAELRRHISLIENEKNSGDEFVGKLQASLAEVREEKWSLTSQLQEISAHSTSLEHQLQASQGECERNKAAIAKEIQLRESTQQKLQASELNESQLTSKLLSSREQFEETVARLTEELNKERVELAKKQESTAQLQSQLMLSSVRGGDLEGQLRGYTEAIASLKAEVDRLHRRLETEERAKENLEGIRAAMREELQSLRAFKTTYGLEKEDLLDQVKNLTVSVESYQRQKVDLEEQVVELSSGFAEESKKTLLKELADMREAVRTKSELVAQVTEANLVLSEELKGAQEIVGMIDRVDVQKSLRIALESSEKKRLAREVELQHVQSELSQEKARRMAAESSRRKAKDAEKAAKIEADNLKADLSALSEKHAAFQRAKRKQVSALQRQQASSQSQSRPAVATAPLSPQPQDDDVMSTSVVRRDQGPSSSPEVSSAAVEELQLQVDRLTSQCKHTNQELRSSIALREEEKKKRAMIEEELKRAQIQVKNLSATMDDLKREKIQELSRLRRKLSEQKMHRDDMKNEGNQLQETQQTLKSKLDQLQVKCDTVSVAWREAQTNERNAKKQLVKLGKENASLEQQLQERGAAIVSLESEVARLKQLLQHVEALIEPASNEKRPAWHQSENENESEDVDAAEITSAKVIAHGERGKQQSGNSVAQPLKPKPKPQAKPKASPMARGATPEKSKNRLKTPTTSAQKDCAPLPGKGRVKAAKSSTPVEEKEEEPQEELIFNASNKLEREELQRRLRRMEEDLEMSQQTIEKESMVGGMQHVALADPWLSEMQAEFSSVNLARADETGMSASQRYHAHKHDHYLSGSYAAALHSPSGYESDESVDDFRRNLSEQISSLRSSRTHSRASSSR
jgi:chromosome segregation ATPase